MGRFIISFNLFVTPGRQVLSSPLCRQADWGSLRPHQLSPGLSDLEGKIQAKDSISVLHKISSVFPMNPKLWYLTAFIPCFCTWCQETLRNFRHKEAWLQWFTLFYVTLYKLPNLEASSTFCELRNKDWMELQPSPFLYHDPVINVVWTLGPLGEPPTNCNRSDPGTRCHQGQRK